MLLYRLEFKKENFMMFEKKENKKYLAKNKFYEHD